MADTALRMELNGRTPDANGLSATEAAARRQADGPNALPEPERRTFLRLVGEAAHEPMFLLLLAGALLYLFLGETREGIFLLLMVLFTLGLTLYQEGKTERALAALRELSVPRARVLRDGQQIDIDSRDVVRGDLLVVAEGQVVAADGILIAGNEVCADESLLTGESEPVRKFPSPDARKPDHAGGADLPFVYAGTLLVSGHGMVAVTATGPHSEIGRIGLALQTLRPQQSPLQKQSAVLIARAAIIGLGLSLFLVLYHGLANGDWQAALLAGLALAMSMVPEEFPVVLTVFPALGAWRLARSQVLTRRVSAVETLGAISVLCVDKTGTLTENRMAVASLYADANLFPLHDAQPAVLPEAFHRLLEFAILASAATPFDPMETAIHGLAAQYLDNTEHIHRDWELVQEYAITSQLRAMSHVWKARDGGDYVVAAKGSSEAIIDLCHLVPEQARRIADAADNMARQGLRVLGVACARFHGMPFPPKEHDFDFSMLGLIGLADPLRADIPGAVRQCREAGIRVLMITGDYPLTASTIAVQAGLEAGPVLTGDELSGLSDAQLKMHLATARVCARIAPEQKLRIVQALEANGDVVAMTGDGVNDAPALRAAHVGIAMGMRGTEVARQAAAIVLLDDSFMSIVRAIHDSRKIFVNMQKSMVYIIAVHVAIAGVALLPVLLAWPIVLYPMHIVALELLIDPACSLVFENEVAEGELMRRGPRAACAPVIGRAALLLGILQGLSALAAVMGAYWWALHALSEPQARAFAFIALIATNLAFLWSNRSRTRSFLLGTGYFNPVLWIVTAGALGLLALTLYLPLLSAIFRFAPPAPAQIVAALGIGVSSAVWFELLKFLPGVRAKR